MTTASLPIGSDYEAEISLTHKNTQSGAEEALTSQTVTARLSLVNTATPAPTAIHASLEIPLTERAEKPGTYYGTFDAEDLVAQLATKVGQLVYLVFLIANDFQAAQPLLVVNE